MDTSLKSEAETALSVTTSARLVTMLLTNVLHANQDSPATAPVSQLAQPTLSMLTETVSHVLKDAMAARTLLLNVPPANQDTSWSEENVLPRAMPDISEMETTDAESAQIPAHHAHQPQPVLHVLKPETNLSTVFATTVFIHAHHALHSSNVLHV